MRFIQLSLLDFFISRNKKRKKRKHNPRRKTTQRKKQQPSDPELKKVWDQLWMTYFPERRDLAQYTIRWSNRRQKRTLASCSLENKRIVVAQELNHPDHNQHLAPLIYHEMCHAALGYDVSTSGKKRLWHGPEFKKLEQRHPGIKALDEWIHSGGWLSAIRSHRARESHKKRKLQNAA